MTLQDIYNNKKITLRRAKEIVGNVSIINRKLGTGTFSFPVSVCQTGSKLRNIKGSVCEKCYASRMSKYRNTIELSWTNNYNLYLKSKISEESRTEWISCMEHLIKDAVLKTGKKYFRFFVGGDIPEEEFLNRIREITSNLPDINFWLPTRELGMIRKNINKYGDFPKNLCIRLSSHMVGDEPVNINKINTSTTHKNNEPIGFNCPSIENKDSNCSSCGFSCWDKSIENISYKLH